MANIKFIGTNQVELVNSLSGTTISPASSGENFIEFSFNTLSKNNKDYYHFVITGSNVEVSGTIDSVTTDYQFFSLFSGCSQITDASQLELTAPTMKKFCFANMFLDCSNLTSPPQLQATNLAQWCYSSMFGNCQKLSSAPILSATTLAKYCYFGMFYNCKSLTSAPNLPAQSLEDWCYNSMFFNCQNLTSISSNFTAWQPQNATTNWVTRVAPSGKFINDNVDRIYSNDNIPVGWIVYSLEPLTFISKSNTGRIALLKNGTPSAITLQYSKNGGTWTDYSINDIIELANGDTIAFSGVNDHFSRNNTNFYKFVMTGTIEAGGNIQSLVNYSNKTYRDYFNQLFAGCSSLIKAPLLPATQLTTNCYTGMFWHCTSLSAAPQLPATTLANHCYEDMFRDCTSLTTPPSLPATTLANECYAQMFDHCTSLTSAPYLPATTLAQYCYYQMFDYCSSLLSAPTLPATTLANKCYNRMFIGCINLTGAPQLPATTLAYYCYENMFHGCTSLTNAPVLSATTLTQGCYRRMFVSCTSLTDAPQLPATTLANNCYSHMFNNCSNLSSISVAFTDWTEASYATTNWVSGVAANGEFTKPNDLPLSTGIDYIPEGWIVVDKDDYSKMPLTFKSTGNTTVRVNKGGMSYNKNNTGWTDYTPNDVISLTDGEIVTFSGTSNNFNKNFVTTGNGTLQIFGNCNSIINYRTQLTEKELQGLFVGCQNIVDASNLILPATTLANQCYRSMFEGCGKLSTAPQLPATELAQSCYYRMFWGCTSLLSTPILPATTLPYDCYNGMFRDCTSLTDVSQMNFLSTSSLACMEMFKGCTSLTGVPNLSATSIGSMGFRAMFENCTSLKKAPHIPQHVAYSDCLLYMFHGCTSLTEIEVDFTEWIGTAGWVGDVAPTGTFTKPTALSTTFGNSYIPDGWTVVNK